ncbi:MAG: thioredoxin [Planctomycetota bacterium]|nr:MAG: thioredoxin [Planctomycetota bacterium]
MEKVEDALQKLDVPSNGATVESTAIRAIPNTPAAKQLFEQLGAQESAAAAEAATIRQLQAKGQAEQNQQPIAEHQRKLKSLLSTAFDLKLQLEELQVKELQSRLSRLERQIGQRKELREKIIARRAGELIEGDALRWTRDAQPVDLGAKQTSLDAEAVPFAKNTGEMLPRTVLASDPLLTCVGIRWLNDGTKNNRGSGTIIESEPGRAVILTCAHLIRDMPADAVIVVDLFPGRPNPTTVIGKLLATDLQADLALLTITVPQRLPITKIRTQDSLLKENDKVFSVGCDGDGKPSREDHVVTKLNKYTGPDNIECTGLPQQGRSGAGLFLDSELIGVCTAADPKDQCGVYVGLKPIAQLLSTARMGNLTSQTFPPRKTQLIPEKDAGMGLELPLTGGEATSVLKADQIVIDLYGGSQVLPGLGKNPGYSKLVQSLNALKGVTTNFREAGKGAVIVMAIVRDPSQRCQREARQTQAESELRIAINSALQAAGIEATQWDENIEAKSADKSEAEGTTSN